MGLGSRGNTVKAVFHSPERWSPLCSFFFFLWVLFCGQKRLLWCNIAWSTEPMKSWFCCLHGGLQGFLLCSILKERALRWGSEERFLAGEWETFFCIESWVWGLTGLVATYIESWQPALTLAHFTSEAWNPPPPQSWAFTCVFLQSIWWKGVSQLSLVGIKLGHRGL